MLESCKRPNRKKKKKKGKIVVQKGTMNMVSSSSCVQTTLMLRQNPKQ